MADSTNHFTSAIEAMFQGVDQLVTTKTVVGDAVRVDDAIILPLMDVTCGMAAGAFDENAGRRRYECQDEPKCDPGDPERLYQTGEHQEPEYSQ